MRLIDLTGQKFGRLTVLSRSTLPAKGPSSQWVCACSCGRETVTSSNSLRTGRTQSCGCLRAERVSRARWKSEGATYFTAHSRVRRRNGAARNYACVDCGQTAGHWSYTGACPEEAVGPNGKSMCTYCPSGHEGCYVPRCTRCHGIHDAGQRENR